MTLIAPTLVDARAECLPSGRDRHYLFSYSQMLMYTPSK
jgi:hypothetical protein